MTDNCEDTCIGYNTLYAASGLPREEVDNGKDLPEGRRLWCWLILCDDGECGMFISLVSDLL